MVIEGSQQSMPTSSPIAEVQRGPHVRATLAVDTNDRSPLGSQARASDLGCTGKIKLAETSTGDTDAEIVVTGREDRLESQEQTKMVGMPILPMNYVPASSVPTTTSRTHSGTTPGLFQHTPTQAPSHPNMTRTYLIIGASRGIGLSLVRVLLSQNHQVIAVVRRPQSAAHLWQLTSSLSRPHQCIIKQCDVADPHSIDQFIDEMRAYIISTGAVDCIILNAGILRYNEGIGAMNVSFAQLTAHLTTNCTGLVVTARKLLELNDLEVVRQHRRQQHQQEVYGHSSNSNMQDYIIGRQTVFISSDSGSMGEFREYEDGFAAYAASKAALNMMVRHMAAELKRFQAGISSYEQGTEQYKTSVNTSMSVSMDRDISVRPDTGRNGDRSNSLLFTGIPTPSPDQNIYTQTIHRHPNQQQQTYHLPQPSTTSLSPPITTPFTSPNSQRQLLPPWQSKICILALHPGEVQTDMADIDLPYQVDGVIGPDESAAAIVEVLKDKDEKSSGGFWRWDGREHSW